MIKKLLLLNSALRLACYALKVVTGKVQDDMVSPPRVSILLKGTSIGTVSDVNGGYSRFIPEPDVNQPVLVFSFIGFEQQEQPVGAHRLRFVLTKINYGLFNF